MRPVGQQRLQGIIAVDLKHFLNPEPHRFRQQILFVSMECLKQHGGIHPLRRSSAHHA